MFAAVVQDTGRPPAYAEFPEPDVAEGFVLADVRAAAVHQIVRAIASGRHYSHATQPPFVPGVDGIVLAPDGRRIYTGGVRPPYGMLAERAAVPAGFALEVPDGLDDVAAAALVNPASSSWMPLSRHLPSGGTVLVLGATGVSGLLAVQAARLLGADRVVAAGRRGPGLERAGERGADVLVPLDGDLESSLRAAADGYDLVLDYLWGEVAEATLGALARLSDPARPVKFVNLGSVVGPQIALPADVLRSSPVQLLGHGIGSSPRTDFPAVVSAIFAAAAAGDLTVDAEPHPLADVERVWSSSGRLVLVP